MTWIAPKEGARRFRTLAREIEAEIIKALRRGQTVMRRRAFDAFASTGIGKVFGRRKRGAGTPQARVVIKRERVRKLGSLYEAGLRLKGFAALVELGGRTRPHAIHARSGSRLAFEVRGRFVAPKRVNHPGSRIPRQPFVKAAARAAEPEIVREVEAGKARAIAAAGLAG